MNLFEFLKSMETKYENVQFSYSTYCNVIEFHLFKNNFEIANGIECINGSLMITLYTDFRILTYASSIVDGTYIQEQVATDSNKYWPVGGGLFSLQDNLNELQMLLEDHINNKSDFQKEMTRKKEYCDKLHKMVKGLPQDKQLIVVQKHLDLEKDFNLDDTDVVDDDEEFNVT